MALVASLSFLLTTLRPMIMKLLVRHARPVVIDMITARIVVRTGLSENTVKPKVSTFINGIASAVTVKSAPAKGSPEYETWKRQGKEIEGRIHAAIAQHVSKSSQKMKTVAKQKFVHHPGPSPPLRAPPMSRSTKTLQKLPPRNRVTPRSMANIKVVNAPFFNVTKPWGPRRLFDGKNLPSSPNPRLGSGMPINAAGVTSWEGPKVESVTVDGILHTRIRGRDYLQQIVGGTGFTVDYFQINPGLPGVFNWLNRQAAQYEQYRFHKLAFEFETVQPTTQGGTIMMYMDYDSKDPIPETEQDFLTNSRAVSSPIYNPLTVYHADERALNPLGQHYVRMGAVPEDSDVRFYDSGIFYVAHDLIDAGLVGEALGRLFVSYDIELMVPHTDDRELSILNTWINHGTDFAFTGSDTTLGELGLIVGVGSDNLDFPLPGFYLLTIFIEGTGSPNYTLWGTLGMEEATLVVTEAVGTTGVIFVYNLHNTIPGGNLQFVADSGTCTKRIFMITRQTTTLDATHSVVSAPSGFGRKSFDGRDYHNAKPKALPKLTPAEKAVLNKVYPWLDPIQREKFFNSEHCPEMREFTHLVVDYECELDMEEEEKSEERQLARKIIAETQQTWPPHLYGHKLPDPAPQTNTPNLGGSPVLVSPRSSSLPVKELKQKLENQQNPKKVK